MLSEHDEGILMLPPQYRAMCLIYGLDPYWLRYDFTDHVVVPHRLFEPTETSKIATSYVLEWAVENPIKRVQYSRAKLENLKKFKRDWENLLDWCPDAPNDVKVAVQNEFLNHWMRDWIRRYRKLGI